MENLLGIIFFIIVLGIIVTVHELGHLIVAKRNGVYCHQFSVGMGPVLWNFHTDKTGTKYYLRALPLGGYVQLAGEDSGMEEDENIPKDELFDNKSKWVRFKILGAGIMVNVVFALLIFILSAMIFPIANPNTNKVDVQENSIVYNAGIRSGDEILSINGKRIKTFNDITSINKDNNTYEFVYTTKNNETKETTLTRNDGEMFGLSAIQTRINPLVAIKLGFDQCTSVIVQIFQTLGGLFTGTINVNQLSGPVGIAKESITASQMGLNMMLIWIAFLSLNLAVMNALPIPALDGGRILFILIELIRGKKMNAKLENTINMIMFFVLIGFIIYITGIDILRIAK